MDKPIKKTATAKAVKITPNLKGSKAESLNDYRRLNARIVNEKRFPNASIYIAQIKEYNLYKIGVSQNVERRFRDIANLSPFKIELLFTKQIQKPYDLELKLHKSQEKNYIKSEWFKLTEKELLNVFEIINNWTND